MCMKSRTLIITFLCIVIIAVFFIGYRLLHERQFIHIALVGPGLNTNDGQLFHNAVNMYFQKINKTEDGINGKHIVCDLYDDKNLLTTASEISIQVVKDNRALAVIGHWFSSCSVAAGNMYKLNKIPAITPGATDISVTKDNDWYFRQIYNNKMEASFLVHYAYEILGKRSITIIHENYMFGKNSALQAEKTANDLDMNIKYIFEFNIDKDSNLMEEQFTRIIERLKAASLNNENLGIILLCTKVREGIQLVKLIKDSQIQNVIMGPLGFATEPFKNGFKNMQKEKAIKGYYTDNVYVSTPLIFDTAGEAASHFKGEYQKLYGKEPDWGAASYYDTAKVIVEALKHADIKGTPESLAEDRLLIRDYLRSLNSENNKIDGITGPIYFDTNGDAMKPVSVAVYKNKYLISPLLQIQIITDHSNVSDLYFDRIVEVDGRDMYKTNVVYTGIEMNEIDNIDTENFSFDASFYLWFRYQEDIQPYDYEMQNLIKMYEKTEIKKDHYGSYQVVTYRIHGKFKMEINARSYAFDEYQLPIRFCHKSLSWRNLIYVVDYVGMNLKQNHSLASNLIRSNVIENIDKWTIMDCFAFQDNKAKNTFKIPGYSINQSRTMNYSQFNFVAKIVRNKLSLRGLWPYSIARILFFITGIIFLFYFSILFVFYLKMNKQNKKRTEIQMKQKKMAKQGKLQNIKYRLLRLFIEATFATIFLLSTEIVVLNFLITNFETYWILVCRKTVDAIWFIGVAFFVDLSFRRLLNRYKTNMQVSTFIPKFASFIIYLSTTLLTLSIVFDINITKLLATGGVLAMIIGLAVQMNIANLISSIAIHFEKPFQINDWVKIGDHEGKVINITWRATLLAGSDSTVVCVPNSVATDSCLINYDYLDKEKDYNCIELTVHISPHYPPEYVRKILCDAVKTANTQLLKENVGSYKRIIAKSPDCHLNQITDSSAEYAVRFYVHKVAYKHVCTWAVWNRIWIHLSFAGIKFMMNEEVSSQIITPKYISEINIEAIQKLFDDISGTSIFETISLKPDPDSFNKLSSGNDDQVVFLIKEGVVRINLSKNDPDYKHTLYLGAGDFIDNTRNAEIITNTVFLKIRENRNSITEYDIIRIKKYIDKEYNHIIEVKESLDRKTL